MPSTIPALPSPMSATRSRKPLRPVVFAPDRPRSASITTTWRAGQPNASARPRSSYWRARLSVCSRTWVGVDWRT